MARTVCDLCGGGVILDVQSRGVSKWAFCPHCLLKVKWRYKHDEVSK